MKTWFIILMLFVFSPGGIFLMYKYTTWNKFVKGALTLLFLAAFISAVASPKKNTPSPSTSKSTSANQAKAPSNAEKEELRKKSNTEVIKALGTFYKKIDEVEKYEWYKQYADSIPPKTAIYWYVGLSKENDLNQRIQIIHFSDGIGWVFWDKVIFSTTEKNWKYEIGSFAGQSGKGKATQVVYGGKYETLDLPIDNLIKGLEVITTGTNPIIRLEGKEHVYDIRLTPEDIANLKKALEFEKNAQIIGNKITR